MEFVENDCFRSSHSCVDVSGGFLRLARQPGRDIYPNQLLEKRYSCLFTDRHLSIVYIIIQIVSLLFPVIEGVYLHGRSQSPYEGDGFHETPTGLFFYTLLLRLNPVFLQMFFICCDVITALALTKASGLFFQSLVV